ncbi:MAG: hypothetical protein H7Y88_01215 [Phycisphaerales bacterium]|nr:hypothetical protein [Phycisphaerales bacterium]
MDAFESLISMLLRHQGYWTTPCFKVELTREDKQRIGRPSSPRWELDLIAYKGETNEVLMVECKSFLDSRGVLFRNRAFEPLKTYKLFADTTLLDVVQNRLRQQLEKGGTCAKSPKIKLCLAIGKLASRTDVEGLTSHFEARGWKLFGPDWVYDRLCAASEAGYENDVAFVVSKLLQRSKFPTASG